MANRSINQSICSFRRGASCANLGVSAWLGLDISRLHARSMPATKSELVVRRELATAVSMVPVHTICL
jgi:hypothetical protein